MYLDLSPRQPFARLPRLPASGHVESRTKQPSSRPTSRRRLVLYLGGLIAASVLWLWGSSQVGVITAQATETAVAAVHDRERTLSTYLTAGDLDARQLADAGYSRLENKDWFTAALYLETAASKDPSYRDAALYTGYAHLRLADELWASQPEEAVRRTRSAATFLEAARAIDPIHAQTFELLEIAYGNLGQTELAAEAKEKSELFRR